VEVGHLLIGVGREDGPALASERARESERGGRLSGTALAASDCEHGVGLSRLPV
jgi:hypothetical protein